ncbi:IclR family transcriptional regulator [Oceanicola sp. 502str15]|uniref:IclR family transcriptional regulator n=1 Tax=Oceanicola sp. 502str15 TaxID=2696061 RepID=UPI002095FFC5|nr:IclR family transcriptional regulator C-terminal domain-containing protein [Oceanicola sp. 502str15]MCO6382674.1 helix-turn-helix domain-containing protein [Oceanicola sp. 502str15]
MATSLNLSVLKAFDALDLLDETRPELTVALVARELRLTNATAHRFLTTLEIAGVLSVVRRGVYAPGPRLSRLGRMAEELAPLPPGLQSVLDRLQQELGESVMACRYTPRGPLCVAVSLAQRPISVQIRTGTTLPMTRTAQGRLFLAGLSPRDRAQWALAQGEAAAAMKELEPELERLRAEGCAVNRGDNEPDIAAVSVPIRAGERTVLTLSAFGTLSRFEAGFVERAKGVLKAAAAELSAEVAA